MSETNRLSRFVGVGLINTLIDLAVLNMLLWFGLPLLLANLFSVSVALVASYFLHTSYVFVMKDKTINNFGLFLAVTLLSLYLLQPAVIYLATASGLSDALASFVSGLVNIDISMSLLANNIAKIIGVAASATANYFCYRNLVFSDEPAETSE